MLLFLFFLSIFFHLPPSLGKEEEKVQIEVLYKPEKCDVKSGKGDILVIDYIGTFPDGKKFDSTYDRNQSMTYTMGNGDVIKGCEIGTMDMCEGEKRRIIVPPSLGYGDEQYGQIPPGSTLHFDTVLVNLVPDPFKMFGSM